MSHWGITILAQNTPPWWSVASPDDSYCTGTRLVLYSQNGNFNEFAPGLYLPAKYNVPCQLRTNRRLVLRRRQLRLPGRCIKRRPPCNVAWQHLVTSRLFQFHYARTEAATESICIPGHIAVRGCEIITENIRIQHCDKQSEVQLPLT